MARNGLPEIYRYTDHRNWLRDALAAWKERDPKVSQRWIGQRLSISSPGWLGDILAGRRNLAAAQVIAMAELFELSPREEMYFETLVTYGQATTIAEKRRAYDRLLTFHEIPRDFIGGDRDAYFSSWLHSVLREFLLTDPEQQDPSSLAARLRPEGDPAEVAASLELLERLGLVRKRAGGRFAPTTEHVKMHPVFAPMQYSRYIQSTMELALGAMERIPKDERDVTALCTTLSREAFEQVREELAALRKRIITLSEAENRKFWPAIQGDTRCVYQFVFGAFPTTTSRSEG